MKNKKQKFLIVEIIAFVIIVVAIASFLIFKSKVTARNFEKLNKEMTYQEVVDLLGNPDDEIKLAAGTEYYWFNGAKSIEDASEKVAKGKEIYYIRINFIGDNMINRNDGEWYNTKNS